MTKERETHLNMISDDRSHWVVFTDDPIMIRLFDSKHYEKIRSVGLGFEYKIKTDKLEFLSEKSIKKAIKKRSLSEDERNRRSERMRNYQAQKRIKLIEK